MSCNNCKRFGSSSADIWVNPVVLSAGWASDATKPCPTGSLTCMNTTGILRVAASRAVVPAGRRRSGGQGGQPVIVALCPAVFDRHVLSLDVAGFAQPLVERSHLGRNRADAAEEADHRHRLLLRAGRATRSPRPLPGGVIRVT